MGGKVTLPLGAGQGDPDTAWKQQNQEQKKNPLYQLINLQKTGQLITVYKNEGPDKLRDFIDKNLECMLYNEGQGKKLTKSDYIRWKTDGMASKYKQNGLMSEEEVLKSDTEMELDFPEDRYNKVTDHMACWDLATRGSMGETALHLLILHNTPSTLDIAKILLEKYPRLAWDYYEGDEYYGESALHIAIVYGDFEMVRLLVECGADVNLRSTGRFFLPEDQKQIHKKKKTNYEGYAYYGEYPLAFAACFGHKEIYDYLIEHGADPNIKDSFGNSVLHMMVISNQLSMFGYAVKHHAKKASLDLSNYQELTPLTLASKLGRKDIFKEIIELQCVEIWRYSNVTCAIYPLGPLDTIGPDGKTNWSSALISVTEGDCDDHLEMLEGGVIKQLLDEKWKTFARKHFFLQLVGAMVHLILLSVAIYLRPATGFISSPHTSKAIVRYLCETYTVIYSLYSILFNLSEICSQGILKFLKNTIDAPAKLIFNISCLLVVSCVPFRILGIWSENCESHTFTEDAKYCYSENTEIVLLAIAAPCAWFYLLFFARGLAPLGPFVIMIYKMFLTDMIKFITIFVIFLLMFSQAFYYLFKDIEDENITRFKTVDGTIMMIIVMSVGEFNYDDFNQTRQPELTKFVFTVFAVFVPILLLNMLIAMMGNTYQLVISRSAKEWKRQWAQIIIVLERSYRPTTLTKMQESYSVDMPGSGDKDGKARGLMVIKTSKKTRARQRKGAINNWKRIVKDIKILIKDWKRTGEPGPLDISSNAMLRAKRSSVCKAPLNLAVDPFDFEESQSAETLLSTIRQVSWYHDIDLTKGHSLVSDQPNNPEDEEHLHTVSDKQLLLTDIENPDSKNKIETSRDSQSNSLLVVPPSGGRSAKVSPELPVD